MKTIYCDKIREICDKNELIFENGNNGVFIYKFYNRFCPLQLISVIKENNNCFYVDDETPFQILEGEEVFKEIENYLREKLETLEMF